MPTSSSSWRGSLLSDPVHGGVTRQVTLDAGRCVHTRIETASCRACVEVCPRRAWQLDDEGLGLSVADCDGCGLCAAACPTRAIAAPTGKPVRRRLNGHTVVMAACERALPEGGDGGMTCLHAIATADLLRHWRRGERVWLISTADCAACERGRGEGFASRVEHLNRLLEARGERRILVRPLAQARWRRVRELGTDAANARRDFLQRLWRRPASALLERPSPDGQADGYESPGRYLSGPGPLPWVVRLDPVACVVCQACIQVCPEQALRLDDDPSGTPSRRTLGLEHERCTGCGLCVDVCAPQAIAVQAWSEPERSDVPLRQSVCRACGAPFLTSAQADRAHLCWVCARGRPARRLYQVMPAA